MSRPRDETLWNLVEYLASIGLTVYGPCMDLDTGDATGSCMDFDGDAVVKYRSLKEKDSSIPRYPDED